MPMITFFDLYTEPAEKTKLKTEKTFENLNKKLQKGKNKAKSVANPDSKQ